MNLLGWKGYVAVAALTAMVVGGPAGAIAWQVRGWKAAIDVSTAKEATAKAVSRADRAELRLSEYRLQYETNRATANEVALKEIIERGRLIDQLRGTITAERRKFAAESERLRGELRDAPASDTQPLSPAIRRYLDGVRLRQSAGPTAAGPAAGNPG